MTEQLHKVVAAEASRGKPKDADDDYAECYEAIETTTYTSAKQLSKTSLSTLRPYSSFSSITFPQVLARRMKSIVNVEVNRARTRSRTLLLAVVSISAVAVVLMVSLVIIMHFAILSSASGKNDVITAHALCQAKYGKCAMFRHKTVRDYPNCSAKIPCQYRCYYPGANLNRIDSTNLLYANSNHVLGRDGLICGERSTCQKGVCKVTSTYAYNNEVNPESMRKCIEETYKSASSRCIDTDRCHQRKYCLIRNQARIGFSIPKRDPKQNKSKLNLFRCAPSCGSAKLPNVADWLHLKKCNRSSTGGCSYTCANANVKEGLPPGTPCQSSFAGYCWHGRCFQKEQFPTSRNER